MIPYFLPLVLVLAQPSPGPAGQVVPKAVVVGPTTRPPGRAILLDGTGSTTTRPLRWALEAFDPDPQAKAVPAPATPLLIFDRAGKQAAYACILDPEAGRYYFSAVATGTDNDADGTPDIDIDILRVTVELAAPPPPPNPTPTPTPTPIPPPSPTPTPGPAVLGHLHASLILDSAAMTLDQAAIRANPTIRDQMAALDAEWHTYDVQSTDLDKYNWRGTITAAGGPPVLIVQASDGKVAGTLAGPKSAADVVAFVAHMRGK